RSPPPARAGSAVARGPCLADPHAAGRGHAEPGDVLEQQVGRAGAALGREVVEPDVAAGVGDDRRPRVTGAEVDAAPGERDVVGVVDVPPVGGTGADALRVVVARVVARHAGAHRAVAAGDVDAQVVERHVADPVAARLAPQRRAELRAALAGDLDVVVGDVVDVPDAGAVAAAAPGPDLLHDRRGHSGDLDVLVEHVGDVGAVHRHQAEAGLARPGDGDVRE